MVIHTWNHCAHKAEAGGSLGVQGQPGFLGETLSQKTRGEVGGAKKNENKRTEKRTRISKAHTRPGQPSLPARGPLVRTGVYKSAFSTCLCHGCGCISMKGRQDWGAQRPTFICMLQFKIGKCKKKKNRPKNP